jgi:glycogen operon protein
MQQEDWGTPLQTLGVLLVGEEIGERDEVGDPIVGNSFLLLLNAAAEPVEFVLPDRLAALDEQVVIDTATPEREGERVEKSFPMDAHSSAVLLVTRPPT